MNQLELFFNYPIPDNELDYNIKNILRKDNYFKSDHIDDVVQEIHEKKDVQHRDNAYIRASNITFAPLLLGDIQFGKLKVVHLLII